LKRFLSKLWPAASQLQPGYRKKNAEPLPIKSNQNGKASGSFSVPIKKPLANLEELMIPVPQLFFFLQASNMTFLTWKVAMAANVSTGFAL